jgi:hypothetical protein
MGAGIAIGSSPYLSAEGTADPVLGMRGGGAVDG